MKLGFSPVERPETQVRNASVYRDSSAHIEGAVLLTVAVMGGLGNLVILVATAFCSRFRTTSSAFLSHHCLLDAIKSLFCIPFACALLLSIDIPYCNAVGATYIFLMTLTAYNLLAIHINEEYHLTERQSNILKANNGGKYKHVDRNNSFCCISFGIFMIWFTTILIHLGVAFLPSSAEFSYDIGNCVFNYGTPKNYVIHILWMLLVTAALGIAIVCFALFYRKLRTLMHSEKWSQLHTSISREFSHPLVASSSPDQSSTYPADVCHEDEQELHYEFADGPDQTVSRQMKLCLRRVIIMLLMVISFLIFWYPLFLLTVLDVHYEQSPQAYRACMVLAWSQPITTPLFCGIIYFDVINMENLRKADYMKAIPMRDSTSFSSASCVQDEVRHKMHLKYRIYDMGFTNENFSFSTQGSPCVGRDTDAESPPQNLPVEGHSHEMYGCSVEESSQHTLIM